MNTTEDTTTETHPATPVAATPLMRVAIVGRPNVGKSALFNRLSGGTRSLVHDLPGVTRDRLYGQVEWEGHLFEVIDTGGLEPGADEPIKASLEQQVQIALREASTILMVTDGTAGLTDLDRHVALLLRRHGKPVILAVNKIDDSNRAPLINEFFALGFGDPIPVSAVHGTNSGDLLSTVVETLKFEEGTPFVEPSEGGLKLAIVGKPNAGKSTLVNKLIGEDRMLVDSTPGTTRDAVQVPFHFGEQDYLLVDTAGLRRKARINDPLEYMAGGATRRAITDCEIAVLVLDATRELDQQDKRIAGYIQEAKRPCVIAVNKWDAVENREKFRKDWAMVLEDDLFFFKYCPVVFISGLTGKSLSRLLEAVETVAQNKSMLTPTHKLTEMVREATIIHTPPSVGKRRLAIRYVSQLRNRQATFVFKVNDARLVPTAYQRYLENLFRKHLGYDGVPLTFIFRDEPKKKKKSPTAVQREKT